ncbi:MAG: bifunctional diguanylate cyclase/phosphodiesterase [Sulfuricaulis sp.]
MNLVRFTGLRARLVALALLAATPVLALIIYSTINMRAQTETDALNRVRQVVNVVAENQKHLIQETHQLLSILARVPQISHGNAAICGHFLSQLLKHYPQYTNLGVATGDGMVFCSALPIKAPIDISDRLYYQRALAHRALGVGEYQIGRISGKSAINLAYPVFDRSNQVRVLVFAAIDLAWLNRFAVEAQLPEDSTLTIIDHKGTILLRFPDTKKWVGQSMHQTPLFSVMRRRGSGVLQAAGEDNINRLYAFTTLRDVSGEPTAYLKVGIPATVAFARVNTLLLHSLLGLGAVVLLMFVFAWIGGDVFILRRIGVLLSAARRVGVGDLSARTGIPSTHDEIGELSSTFDDMAERLEQRDLRIRENEARIARLNRVYVVLSSVNGAIIRMRERDALLREACRIAVEQGRFQFACVSLADPASARLVPVYSAGDGTAFGSDTGVRLTPANSAGADPVGAVLYGGKVVIINDLMEDPRFAPSAKSAPRQNFRSCALLPLTIAGKTIACLHLYADEAGFFDNQEMRLMDELAADISLGLSYIDKEDKLHSLVYYDVLTGLPNRVLFRDRLEQSLARAKHHGRHVAVLSMHIDRLNDINSIHGQHVGDALLREAARHLRGLVRDGDTVARSSSSAFNIVLADVAHTGDVIMVARKIMGAFALPMQVEETELFVPVRIGIAVYPDDGDNIETILKNAGTALTISQRESGSSYRFYTPEINVRASERFEIERDLHHALERGELALFYQPVVDMKTRKITGCEALLRWNNANHGNVSPAKFIPIAEETGLIIPIGEWVLKTACRQGREWHEQGLPLRMAVNVSAKQFQREDFPETILRIMKESGFDSSKFALTMEITETELMENAERSAAFLKDLQARGLSISIDDFGTGYSSLSYLKQLPVDTLKIDISFVRNIARNRDDPAIVKAIIALAHSLNMKVVAEGVETREQFDVLHALGCDNAQGYLFSPAVPAADFTQLCNRAFDF